MTKPTVIGIGIGIGAGFGALFGWLTDFGAGADAGIGSGIGVLGSLVAGLNLSRHGLEHVTEQ